MNNSTLGCWWVVIAKILENKGIPRFSFRFESLFLRHTTRDTQRGCPLLCKEKGSCTFATPF